MITIDGDPKGKQRPRFSQGHTYTPAETQEYEKIVHDTWIWQEKRTYHGYVRVEIRAYFKIPDSYSESVKMAMRTGERRPAKRPDIDNIEKIIYDGLNGAAYDDDAQIVETSTEKWYSDNPRVEIEVIEI